MISIFTVKNEMSYDNTFLLQFSNRYWGMCGKIIWG